MCKFEDWDSADFINETWRRARKSYECIECGYKIDPGERYLYVSMGYEGTASSHRVCWFCDAMAHALMAAQRFHCGQPWGWLVSELWSEVREFYEEHKDELGKPYDPRHGQRGDVVMGATWND